LRRFEIDPTWWTLRVLEKLGVVWNLHTAQLPRSAAAMAEAGR
jgi:fatty-acid desaturase